MKSIIIHAPINSLSYGIAAKNIAIALSKIADVYLVPVQYAPDRNTFSSQEEHDTIVALMNKGQNYPYASNVPCIKIYHQNMMNTMVVTDGPKIGYSFFELDRLTDIETRQIQALDGFLVASNWAREVVFNSVKFLTPLGVVPLGVDTNLFSPGEVNHSDITTFLNIGKFEVRKGHDFIYDIFSAAFPNNERVALLTMPFGPFLTQQEHSFLLQKKAKDSRIFLLERTNTVSELVNIIRKAKCGIFPSRAEGWNLPALEMMACGKHVIATKYSAHTQYMTPENAMLIDCDEVEPAKDGRWFDGNGNWARISQKQIDQMITYMREVYDKDHSGKLGRNEAGVKTAKQFTWDNTAEQLLKVVQTWY
jgi:glycosyltransferase involved in cell wall biosynthesis